jgi:predicted ATPase
MIGRNGAGKTTILNVLETIGKFSRGGPDRAFGPPPWSLGWQRTKGMGSFPSVDFEVEISNENRRYHYDLRLDERQGKLRVVEERLTRLPENVVVSAYDSSRPPDSGTILNPGKGTLDEAKAAEIQEVSKTLAAFESYELNPSNIERGNEPRHTYVTRDGFGVAGFLANLKDNDPAKFQSLENRFKSFRPDTESLKVWATGNDLFWGLREVNHTLDIPALHLSWGDRQLLGVLCVLYSTQGGATIAFEEIDRGFHPSRYAKVIELLSEAAYDGIDGQPKIQIVATTHSPSFINKLGGREAEIRMVTKASGGSSRVRSMQEVVLEALGTDQPEQPLGEIWELGLLEEIVSQAM